jgi:hypothetical protein
LFSAGIVNARSDIGIVRRLDLEAFYFSKEVQKNFAFLLENGFVLSRIQPLNVVYTRGMYEVDIDLDARSGEITVGIRSKNDRRFGTASFSFLLGAFDKSACVPATALEPATPSTDRPAKVRALADTFARYVKFDSFDTPALWTEVKRLAMEWRERTYPTITWDELMERFDRCWTAGQYQHIVDVFTAFRDELNAERQAKLQAATNKVRSGNLR